MKCNINYYANIATMFHNAYQCFIIAAFYVYSYTYTDIVSITFAVVVHAGLRLIHRIVASYVIILILSQLRFFLTSNISAYI